jgi:hypothetical protein
MDITSYLTSSYQLLSHQPLEKYLCRKLLVDRCEIKYLNDRLLLYTYSENSLSNIGFSSLEPLLVEWKSTKVHIFIDASNVIRREISNDAFHQVLECSYANRNIFRKVIVGSKASSQQRHTAINWKYWEDLGYEITILDRIVDRDGHQREQTVDDVLHSSMQSDIIKEYPEKRVMIVFTGDGNINEGRTSFPAIIEQALGKRYGNAWSVELYSWAERLSNVYKQFEEYYPNHFSAFIIDNLIPLNRVECQAILIKRSQSNNNRHINKNKKYLKKTNQNKQIIKTKRSENKRRRFDGDYHHVPYTERRVQHFVPASAAGLSLTSPSNTLFGSQSFVNISNHIKPIRETDHDTQLLIDLAANDSESLYTLRNSSTIPMTDTSLILNTNDVCIDWTRILGCHDCNCLSRHALPPYGSSLWTRCRNRIERLIRSQCYSRDGFRPDILSFFKLDNLNSEDNDMVIVSDNRAMKRSKGHVEVIDLSLED